MTLQEARDHMKSRIEQSGRSISDWAREIGVSRSLVHIALTRSPNPSPKILKAFGLEVSSKVITKTYKRIDQ